MNIMKWKVRKWVLRMQVGRMRRQVRGLQRRIFHLGRKRRARQLELPFRG
jgi:hypothetical protein